jgi:hypothetical protein
MIRLADHIRGLAGWQRCGGTGGRLSGGLFHAALRAVAGALLAIPGHAAAGRALRRNWRALRQRQVGLVSAYFAVAFHWIGFAFLVDASTYLWMMPSRWGRWPGAWRSTGAGSRGGSLGWRGLSLVFGLQLLWRSRNSCAAAVHGISLGCTGLAGGMGNLAQTASLIGMTGLTP